MRTRLVLLSATVALAFSGSAYAAAVAQDRAGGQDAAILATGGFDLTRPEVVASGLEVPWGMAFLPDGSALVAERMSARILQLRPGSPAVPVAQVPGVAPSGEGGLLGLAVSPTYAQDSYVYAYFTASNDNRIVRFRLASPQTQEVVLSGLAKASIHDGGRIAFGPDGMLYAGVGDAGQTANAQNQQSLNGKILRMRPDGGVPTGNPFANSLVYSLGHRNVQGLAWDSAGRLFATEFGQNTWDEVNLIVAGGNYGWPTVEGMSSDTRFRNPLIVWSTAEASPSGAAIANNTLFAAALAGRRLWTVPLNGSGGVGTPTAELQGTYGRLRTVVVGPDGWLWITTSNRDGRGSPVASDDRVVRFPPSTTTSPSASASVSPSASRSVSPSASASRSASASPSASVSRSASASPSAGVSCSVQWELNQWSNGFVATVTITNRGAALNGWALTWTFSGNQQITNFWNSQVSQSGAAVTARNASWNAAVPAGGSVTFGFQATYSGTNARPAAFQLNGSPCA